MTANLAQTTNAAASAANRMVQTGIDAASSAMSRFCIPKPRSMMKFIVSPSLWRLPNLANLASLGRRVKNNLLYFQTNYLIIALAFFALSTIFLMKTLLMGIVSATVIVVGVLFFLEHIPQARQIKQNHPTIVIIMGIVIIFTAWHAVRTILVLAAAALMPLPFFLLHASMRFSENLLDDNSMGGDYFVYTPVGQIMQMLGLNPRVSAKE